jgi:hypothetical protein
MSTAILGSGGVAHAATTPVAPVSFDHTASPYTVLPGYCSITWTVVGGHGGANAVPEDGAPGGRLVVTTRVDEGDVYELYLGADGGAGSSVAGTGGENGSGADSGWDGTAAGAGGGGAASSVMAGDVTVLLAQGGQGADSVADAGDGGAGGYGSNLINTEEIGTSTDTTATPGSAGGVSGVANPCDVPNAPSSLSVTAGDTSMEVWFQAGEHDWSEMAEVTGWEISTNGGTTWAALDATGSYGSMSATVTGLTNGTVYSVKVRADSAAGPSAASEAVSAAPAVPAGAPTNIVATAGPSSIKVTWDPPTAAGTYPIASYDVGWGTGAMGSSACQVAVNAERVCVFPATPGVHYTVGVSAVDTKGNRGVQPSGVSAGVIPGPSTPASVPTSNGDLQRPAGETGSVTAGKKITLSGSGYMPNSTISVIIYSEPQVLTSVVTDATGSFTVEVTVPAGLVNGQHTLVASGVDPSGNVRYMTLPVTVTGGTTGVGGLAATGADIAVPLAGGLAVLALGAGLIVVSRRRSAA